MKEYLDAARETVEYMNAITRMNRLSEDPFDHAKIINLGATAWAMGVTPEMMNVFGKIASTMRVTNEDIRQLERRGIDNRITPKTVTCEISLDTGPFEEALKRYVEQFQQKTRPWLAAKDGEIWEIFMPGEAILCRADDDGDFTPVFGHNYWATIANGSNVIAAGRRIWPEAGDDQ